MKPLRVALLGCGTVGTQVVRLLLEQSDDFAARVGARLELVGVAVRDRTLPRPGVPTELITDDAEGMLTRTRPDIVIELMGGIEPARSLLLQAMGLGAAVVTANKALLAEDGVTLYEAADRAGVDIYFEAAVAGAIPLLRPLRESLAGDRITEVMGIVNGTTNYILDRMDTEGAAFADVLADAQALGYAEADPTADVDGLDAAAKAAIIASIAFHTRVNGTDVHAEGIRNVTATDVAIARRQNRVIKLLAVAKRTDEGPISIRVAPVMIPRSHPLASVREAFNAVFVRAEAAGELMFYGRGAGGAPTASAVLGDVVAVARNRARGAVGVGYNPYANLGIADFATIDTRFYILLDVVDRPGALASVAGVFAQCGVSIETVRQSPTADGGAMLSVVTHAAPEGRLAAVVEALRDLGCVRRVASTLRVEGI